MAASNLRTRRRATIEDLGLTKGEFAVLRRHSSPEKIQKYLLEMNQNFELDGDSCASVRMVLLKGAGAAAADWHRFLLSPTAQAVIVRHGYALPQ